MKHNKNPQGNSFVVTLLMIALSAIAKYLMKTSLFQKNNILFFNKPYATRTDPLGNEGKRISSVSENSFHEWLGGQWVFYFDCYR